MAKSELLGSLAAHPVCEVLFCDDDAKEIREVAAAHCAQTLHVEARAGLTAADLLRIVAAVQAAELVEALKGEGPFTVFAPTDAAFGALPAGTVENLLKPENQEALQSVLLYHVVSGKIMAADIGTGAQPATLQGATINVVGSSSGVTVNGANVVAADVITSNGVIHVIDAVILPPASSAQAN